MQKTPRFPTKLSKIPNVAMVVSDCLGSWIWWNDSWGNNDLGCPFQAGSMEVLYSQGTVLQMNLLFLPLEPMVRGVWSVSEISSWHLSYSSWLLLNGDKLFRNHAFLSPSFIMMLWQGCKFFKSFCFPYCYYLLLSYCCFLGGGRYLFSLFLILNINFTGSS
jgi:hypothetical protein